MELGYARTPLRRKLVDAALRGEKTATASLVTDYAPYSAERSPVVGTSHERFWHEQGITDDTLVVCERFRLVESNP